EKERGHVEEGRLRGGGNTKSTEGVRVVAPSDERLILSRGQRERRYAGRPDGKAQRGIVQLRSKGLTRAASVVMGSVAAWPHTAKKFDPSNATPGLTPGPGERAKLATVVPLTRAAVVALAASSSHTTRHVPPPSQPRCGNCWYEDVVAIGNGVG